MMTIAAGDEGLFYTLEFTVFDAIFAQYPAYEHALRTQLRHTRVTRRHNTGAGFFTSLEVDRRQAEPVPLVGSIGHVWAEVDGFDQHMTFLVFMRDGFLKTLEGALPGDEGTEGVDFALRRCRISYILPQ